LALQRAASGPLRHPSNSRSSFRGLTTLATLASLLLASTGAAACRGPATAFGESPAAAKANAEDFFAATAARFTNVTRNAKFSGARPKLAKAALTPSKIYDDSSVWTAATRDSVRVIDIHGAYTAGRYLFNARAGAVPTPQRHAESRHHIRLKRLSDSEFAWDTEVDFAMGRVRAAELAEVLGAFMSAAEGRGEREVRAEYRAHFPRATAALGRLFTLDSVRSTVLADGSSATALKISIVPERLEKSHPAFAQYVKKYVEPSSYRFVLGDRRGNRWFEATAGDNVLRVRVRTREGRLVTLDGSPRPMPDSLQLTGAFLTHIMFWDVGVSDLQADFTFLRGEHERGWTIRFAREPEWHFPMATKHLIRAPLRRPFEQGGVTLRVAVRDSAGAQTIVGRRLHMVVKESAILRWLGALGTVAMNDFAGKSEAEENRFIAEAFGALQADVRALAVPAAGSAIGASSP
jgi:hypothetical protein